jgi:enoyl-CoA hydratase/carnithine racemase
VTVILQETDGPVAWVWLNRPGRLNAIDANMLSGLRSAFEELGQSDQVRAIVLAAHGPTFSAGFDLEWMLSPERESDKGGTDGVYAAYEAVESCRKPVIAAIQGAAVGGGLLLALAADIRLASDTASFLAPEVRISLFPALGLVPKLAHAVGVGAAKRMLLTGDSVSAAEALRMGLVEGVVPIGELVTRVRALAEGIAAHPPFAVQQTKAAFVHMNRPTYRAWEQEQFEACWQLPERDASMRAFLEGRNRNRS